jgi:hypothetical protein
MMHVKADILPCGGEGSEHKRDFHVCFAYSQSYRTAVYFPVSASYQE